jgi:elongator complex protein 5
MILILTACSGFVVFMDSLQTIASHTAQDLTFNLPSYLSSLISPDAKHPKRQISLVAVYHTDVPHQPPLSRYAPSPLAQLSYLATSIMTLHSVAHLLAAKAARDRSLAAPVFGLAEEADGILIGLNRRAKTLKADERGIVIELEHRRKSGRGVVEWFFLPSQLPKQATAAEKFREYVTLLDDHPLFRKQVDAADASEDELSRLTFDLSLTERQKQEREGVVLPYFDAQKAGGVGEGGRILYDMGAEDDFDDEEDED